MSKQKYKALKNSMIFIIISMSCCVFVFNYIANDLLSPKRRNLQPYHLEILKNNDKHGIRIKKTFTHDKKIPYLIIYPQQESISSRGKTLQQELFNNGFSKQKILGSNGVIVLIHGRSGRKEDLLLVAERFAAAGFHCLLPDLPAHGESPVDTFHFASTTFEKNYANNVLEDAKTKLNLDKKTPAFLWGMSIGGVFVNASAQSMPKLWNGMVIVASFDTLKHTLQTRLHSYHVPQFLHTVTIGFLQKIIDIKTHIAHKNRLPLNQINPQTWAKDITIPTYVIHGNKDTIINIKQSKKLYEAYASNNKKWLTVPNAGHNNVLITETPVYAEMASWLLTVGKF